MFIQALRQLVPSRRRADGPRSATTGLSLPVAPGRIPRPERAWNPDLLQMDAQTFRDLEIFEVEGGARSLFELLDTTRTAGGSKVLRSRMRQPFSSADRIRRVQDAVRYIAAHRAAFDLPPGEIVLTVVEGYIYSALTLSWRDRRLSCFLSFEIRFGEAKEFWQITRGVQTTARLIRALKQLLERPQLANPPGELATIVGELRTAVEALSAERLSAEGEAQLSAWRLMRLDQTLLPRTRTSRAPGSKPMNAAAGSSSITRCVLASPRSASVRVLTEEGVFDLLARAPEGIGTTAAT